MKERIVLIKKKKYTITILKSFDKWSDAANWYDENEKSSLPLVEEFVSQVGWFRYLIYKIFGR